MDGMTHSQKVQLGAEIRRVRTTRPKISRARLAMEAGIAENTAAAVEGGVAQLDSVRAVLDALGRLGRPVEIVPGDSAGRESGPAQDAPVQVSGTDPPVPTDPNGAIVALVAEVLRIAQPDEREEIKTNLWLLLRGRHAELIERLSHS